MLIQKGVIRVTTKGSGSAFFFFFAAPSCPGVEILLYAFEFELKVELHFGLFGFYNALGIVPIGFLYCMLVT